jgi:mono/diheme cytochrome c family protein
VQGHHDAAAGAFVGEDRRRLRKRLICGVLATRSSLALLASITSSVLFALACGAPPANRRTTIPTDLAGAMHAYADDPAVGRHALEISIVNHENGYSALRLARYDERHWGRLPELDARTAPILVGAGGAPAPAPALGDPSWASLDPESVGWSLAELTALGERAFFRYPLQPSDTMPGALAGSDHGGVWEHEGRFGAVWVTLPRGVVRAAFTCATCHASKVADRLVPGRNNADLDAARIYDSDSVNVLTGEESGSLRTMAGWGRGRVDVTADGIDNPVSITDLRPVRYQQNLHHAATLRNDPIALAVRVETLIVTSHAELVRPPRKIAAALAVYLLSLAPITPLPTGDGAVVFARECASCHQGEAASGPPVPLAAVGTDPAVGTSPDRGTGSYRVPSLRAVGDRRRMFASGDIDDLDALLAPDRAVPGHRFGLTLDAKDRTALLAYLRGL